MTATITPFMSACFDRDLPELGPLRDVEFFEVWSYRGFGPVTSKLPLRNKHERSAASKMSIQVRANHYPKRGWTVSAHWDGERWIKGRGWPPSESVSPSK